MLSMDSRTLRISIVLTVMALLALILVSMSPDNGVEAGTPRSPIDISGDTNFTVANGVVSGNGTAVDPYIIEGWDIDYDYLGITIIDTTKHFKVRNIIINGSRWSSGTPISLRGVGNGTFDDIVIIGDNMETRLQSCSNVTISNLTTEKGGYVYVIWSEDIELQDVDLSDDDGHITVTSTERCRLVRCKTTGFTNAGIRISSSGNTTLLECNSSDNALGLYFTGVKDSLIVGCILQNNWGFDAYLYGSEISMRNNRMGPCGFTGIITNGTIDQTNTVNGKPLRYHTDKKDVRIDGNAGQVYLFNCNDILITNLTLDGARQAIDLRSCTNATISNAVILSPNQAIAVREGTDCTIANCTINMAPYFYEQATAVYIEEADNVTLKNVSINGTFEDGVMVDNYKNGPFNLTLDGVRIHNAGRYGMNLIRMNRTVIKDCELSRCNDNVIHILLGIHVEIQNSTFTDCDNAIDFYGIIEGAWIHNSTFTNSRIFLQSDDSIVEGNTVTNSSWRGIAIFAHGCSVLNNTVINCSIGIHLNEGSICDGNTILDSATGIWARRSDQRITNNTIRGSSKYGIELVTSRTEISNCTIIDCTIGIQLSESGGGANIMSCLIAECYLGINIEGGSSEIHLNDIRDCESYAISGGGYWQYIYWNTFERNNYDELTDTYNGPQALPATGAIYFKDKEGNYWADYTRRYPNAKVVNWRYWDTPYRMWSTASDDYPLVCPVDLVSPVAIAGDDVTVPQDTLVIFNASASHDDVGVFKWAWVFMYRSKMQNISGEVVSYPFNLTGVYNVTLMVWDRWGNQNKDFLTVTVLDTEAPVPNVGQPIFVGMGENFTIDGSASRDNVGIVNYEWTLDPGGLDVVKSVASFSYMIDTAGEYIAILNVSDAAGNWAQGNLTITVRDIIPPVANAGSDFGVDQGIETTFDGTGSSDNVGIVNYRWRIDGGGSPVQLSGPNPTHTFSEPGIYTVTLIVADERGFTDSDELVVTVYDTTPPVAVASDDVTIDEGGVAALDGLGSSDNVGVVGYRWSYEVEGETVEHTGAQVDLTFELPGVYNIVLRVEDARGNWGEDFVIVTVKDITRPSADAGGDRTVGQGEVLVLDGGASTDNVAVVLYEWTIEDTEGSVFLEGMSVSHTFQTPGVFQVTLEVADEAGLPDLTTIQVTVVDVTPPVAEAGDDVTVLEATTHKLDGSGSTDNVAIVRYSWTFTYKEKQEELTGARPSFYFDKEGEVEIELEVEDAEGNRASDTVLITVMPERVTWAIGPFVDADGKPVEGARVTVLLAGLEHEEMTDEQGWARIDVKWVDLVSPANVTVSKSGWKDLEFDIELDDDGNPTGDIPDMKRKKADESPAAGAALVVMAMLASLVAFGRGRKR